jgi:hypothetical protein
MWIPTPTPEQLYDSIEQQQAAELAEMEKKSRYQTRGCRAGRRRLQQRAAPPQSPGKEIMGAPQMPMWYPPPIDAKACVSLSLMSLVTPKVAVGASVADASGDTSPELKSSTTSGDISDDCSFGDSTWESSRFENDNSADERANDARGDLDADPVKNVALCVKNTFLTLEVPVASRFPRTPSAPVLGTPKSDLQESRFPSLISA